MRRSAWLTLRVAVTEPTADPARAAESSQRYDVVVIGAGQAGLAIGYFLARQGRDS